jgi:hypothetical protein
LTHYSIYGIFLRWRGRRWRVRSRALTSSPAAILLLGGDKTGNDRWYDEHVPIADRLYDEYIRELEREGLT